MQVVDFIRKHGTAKLTEETGISVKAYPEKGLMVLNYNQIESPKTHPLVIECRSLMLCMKTLGVVSRSFDRFFNYGEALNVMPEIDWDKAVVKEKVDGSLIKIYYHDSNWEIATRGTAFAESDCMGFGVSFRELVLRALGMSEARFQECCNSKLNPLYTYIGELTSVENRVVKHYHGYNLWFLAARENRTGLYDTGYEKSWALDIGFKDIKSYPLSSADDALRAARELKDLDEGFIVYQNGTPICKIKSPAYVAVHHIRGEGLNPKRMSQLVLSGEVDEYLVYFPEDLPTIQPYITAYEKLCLYMEVVWHNHRHIEDQKEFAVAIAKYNFKGVLFNCRLRDCNVMDSFNKQRDCWKIEMLSKYLEN